LAKAEINNPQNENVKRPLQDWKMFVCFVLQKLGDKVSSWVVANGELVAVAKQLPQAYISHRPYLKLLK